MHSRCNTILTDFCISPSHSEAFSFSLALGLSYKALMAWYIVSIVGVSMLIDR